jgi:hypothetical protein
MIGNHSFTFKTETADSFETFITTLQSTLYLLLQGNNLHNRSREKPENLGVKAENVFIFRMYFHEFSP